LEGTLKVFLEGFLVGASYGWPKMGQKWIYVYLHYEGFLLA